MMKYNHKKIEKKWQKIWDEEKTFRTDVSREKEKCYVLDMFPYPCLLYTSDAADE